MTPPSDLYHFRPLTRADYPLIESWLCQSHIGGWWGDAATEIALIEQDLDQGPLDMRIVELNGTPLGFIQDYPAHHWPAPHFTDLPADTRAIDMFLGDPASLGQGHARRFIRQRVAALLAGGASVVATDPDPKNAKAIATFQAAGFEPGQAQLDNTGAPVLPMTVRRSSVTHAAPTHAFPDIADDTTGAAPPPSAP